VWMNYVRNRTHAPRLQVDVKAEFSKRGDRHYLVATCQAKNVGLSVFLLRKRKWFKWIRKLKNKGEEEKEMGLPGTALSVRMLLPFAPESVIIGAPWEEIVSFEVLSSHDSVEPGLTISEQKLISLPDLDYDAVWVELRVSAHREKWSAIAVAVAKEDSENSGLAPN
jgi:hypothetical protein